MQQKQSTRKKKEMTLLTKKEEKMPNKLKVWKKKI